MLNPQQEYLWLERLRLLQGDFHRSDTERWTWRLGGLGLLGFAAYNAAATALKYAHNHDGGDALALSYLSVMALIPGIYLLRRCGDWYRFALGQVQLYSGGNDLKWEAPVNAIQRLRYRYTRNGSYLELTWPDRKRRVNLYPSLDEALRFGVSPAGRGFGDTPPGDSL